MIHLTQFAFIFLFNGAVGQAIIYLPKALSKAGLLLSILLLTAIAGVNYITAILIVEAMAIANAYSKHEAKSEKWSPNSSSVEKDIDVSFLLVRARKVMVYIAVK